MAEQIELEVAPRIVTGKANKNLRKTGVVPANIYGHNQPSQAIQVNASELERLRRSGAGRSVLKLRLPDAGIQTVLLRHMQHRPSTGKIVHVDFFRVSMTERINMKVPLHFVGESSAVKLEGGVLLHLMEAIEVECTASDIIESIDVDISSLTALDAALHASDVKLPANFRLITDPEEAIAKVSATRAAETATAEASASATSAATPEA